MKKQRDIRSRPKIAGDTVRISLTLEADKAARIEAIASEGRVTAAWVIRSAIDLYLSSHGPGAS